MKRFLLFAIASLFVVSCSTDHSRRLVILHTNDTHSHLDPSAGLGGGVMERAAYIDSVRAAEGRRNVLLVHCGDFNQGTSYFTIGKGRTEVELVNALGYDCITLGNHEFDNGIEDLGERLSRIKCPVVCANYDFSPFEMGRYVRPYTVIERGGYRIGITAVLCDLSSMVSKETSDRIPRLGDNATVINKWASYLRGKKKCDIVLALTHIGFEEDLALAPQLSGVDFIIGAHSHTRLDAPVTVNDRDGKPLPIVTDGCWGTSMGELTLTD